MIPKGNQFNFNDEMSSFFTTVIILSAQSCAIGLCVINNMISYIVFNLSKNNLVLSKLTSAILPNTSSNTITFGFGSVDILPKTLLSAKDDNVASKPEPLFNFLVTLIS